jgi:hypothetical protein
VRVALVNHRLENLHALAGDFGSLQPANQLLALPGKHGADDYLNPAHIPFYDVHASGLLRSD